MVTSAIERSLMSNAVVFPERGGFWRRAAALWFDLFLVGLVLLIATTLAYELSGGRLQASPQLGVITHSECVSLAALPAGIDAPPAFGATYGRDCISDVFGYPVSHQIAIGRETDDDGVTTDESVTFTVDKLGRPVRLPTLDLLVLPATIAWRCWLDRRKGSPGRRIFAVRVSLGGTEAIPASPGRLAKRYGAFALIFAPAWLVALYEDFSPGFAVSDQTWPVGLGAVAVMALLVLAAVVAIVRRNESFYDRFAGTSVMRVRPSV
jgi:hypothetical protein